VHFGVRDRAASGLELAARAVGGFGGAQPGSGIDDRERGVMQRAVAAGASFINDINALMAPGALEAAAQSDAAVCLMHMQGDPRSMQQAPHYNDVVTEVRDFLVDRVAACRAGGIAEDRIVIDPGIGFGKTVDHNLQLLRGLSILGALGQPLLVGVSRKNFIGKILGLAPDQRLEGSLAAAVAAVLGGANIIRVHDVAETCRAVRVADALRFGFHG